MSSDEEEDVCPLHDGERSGTDKNGEDISEYFKELKRVSKPSLRKYSGATDLDSVKGGLGSFIVSTNQGLMTDKDAKAKNVGGEILCEVF